MKIVYDPDVDALHIWLQETTVTTKEVAEGVSADYDRNGQLAGIQILDASKRLDGLERLRTITVAGVGEVVAVWPSPDGYGYCAEALAWLQQGGGSDEWRTVVHSSKHLTSEDAIRLARELYAAGAVQVRVLGKYLDEDGESADYLEVVLPQDTEARKRLFGIQERVMRETGSAFDPAVEEGQTSFTIGW